MVVINVSKISKAEMRKKQLEYIGEEEKKVFSKEDIVVDWDKVLHGLTLLPTTNLSRPFQGYRTINIYIRNDLGKEETRHAIAHEMYHAVQWMCGCEGEESNILDVEVQMVEGLVERK